MKSNVEVVGRLFNAQKKRNEKFQRDIASLRVEVTTLRRVIKKLDGRIAKMVYTGMWRSGDNEA